MVETDPELSSGVELPSNPVLSSNVKFEQLSHNFPIPYLTGEGGYIQSRLPIPEKRFSNEEKQGFCEVVNGLKANYFATEYEVKTSWKEKGEGNSSLVGIYVDAGDGRCGSCMHFGETLEFFHTKKPIHILFFQECLAKYYQFQGISYPHIKSERKENLTEFSFEIDGLTIRELVEIDKYFAGKQILGIFTHEARKKS